MSKRTETMKSDIECVFRQTQSCGSCNDCPFKNFQLQGPTRVVFTFDRNGQQRSYTLHLCASDYPENTLLTCVTDPDDTEIFNIPVPAIIKSLGQAIGHTCTMSHAMGAGGSGEKAKSALSKPVESSVKEPVQDPVKALGRGVSLETDDDDEYYTDASEDFNDDDFDYYAQNGLSDEESNMHPQLAQDMELIKEKFGDDSLSFRIFDSIDDIDVELRIDMSFLDAEICKAWKILRFEPVIIRLHLNLSTYLDGPEPKVEVFQPSKKGKFGVGSQVRKIMEEYVICIWKKVSNHQVEAKRTSTDVTMDTSSQPPKKKLLSSLSNQETTDALPLSSAMDITSNVCDTSMARLLDMGFSAELARNSLIITHNNVDESLNLLLTNPESCEGILVDADTSSHVATPAAAPQPTHPSQPKKPPLPTRQHSHPKSKKDRFGKPQFHRQLSKKSKAPTPLEDLNLLPSSTVVGKNAKQVPILDEWGFLVQTMQYARQRIATLNEFCVVCDEPHVFQNGAMLKPAVCARELCVFSFQTLGVMSDAAEDIATGAEVVDLLISMAMTANKSTRRDVIFDPFPTVVDPSNPKELALHPKKKDYGRVEAALDKFPTMREMTHQLGTELKKEMDGVDILAYPLLQWIITSNRSHIVKLPTEKQLSFMHTPHQFLLLSSPPAKEAIFRQAKQKYGSTFAFHGSNIENWHSILRVGLINASGTKMQMHGAAYGNGIYLSPHASVSFGYSGMGYGYHRTGGKNPQLEPKADPAGASGSKGKSRFLQSKNLTCIALCEVICSDLKKTGSIWVMPQPDHVCTRFFFVYEDGRVGDQNIDTQQEKFQKEIMAAIGSHIYT